MDIIYWKPNPSLSFQCSLESQVLSCFFLRCFVCIFCTLLVLLSFVYFLFYFVFMFLTALWTFLSPSVGFRFNIFLIAVVYKSCTLLSHMVICVTKTIYLRYIPMASFKNILYLLPQKRLENQSL